ncbi:hypothetical protein J0H33_06940, partial [bacterium]|nr:hypothetical protein [bacterium]
FYYCFNYFQEYRERDDLPGLLRVYAVQLSCLQLGFYLASWGMLRGSSKMLQRSVRALEPVIEVIATAPSEIWQTDADSYGDGACPVIFETAAMLRTALQGAGSDILVTKIMLGTFGCVPAFDTYFRRGFGTWKFGPKALRDIGAFYHANTEVIERHRVETLDLAGGWSTSAPYLFHR